VAPFERLINENLVCATAIHRTVFAWRKLEQTAKSFGCMFNRFDTQWTSVWHTDKRNNCGIINQSINVTRVAIAPCDRISPSAVTTHSWSSDPDICDQKRECRCTLCYYIHWQIGLGLNRWTSWRLNKLEMEDSKAKVHSHNRIHMITRDSCVPAASVYVCEDSVTLIKTVASISIRVSEMGINWCVFVHFFRTVFTQMLE